MHRGITPLGRKMGLAAKAEALDHFLVAIIGRQLEIIEELATASDHFEEAAAGAVIFGILFQVARNVVDALRQDRDLDIGAAGVFVVDFEAGRCSSGFAHGSFFRGYARQLVRRWFQFLELKGRDVPTDAWFGKEFFTVFPRRIPDKKTRPKWPGWQAIRLLQGAFRAVDLLALCLEPHPQGGLTCEFLPAHAIWHAGAQEGQRVLPRC